MDLSELAYYACIILAFVPAIVLHEVSHGYAAYKLGDPTAKRAGRLTLNPAAHVDMFGTIILPIMLMLAHAPVFGYAKPVPYNPSYFEDRRKGDVIVGLAGPAANFVMALIGSAVAWLLVGAAPELMQTSEVFSYFYGLFLPYFVLINLFLMFFNLLPIPPLDGSCIYVYLVPKNRMDIYYNIERYGMPVLLILLFALPYIFPVSPISMYMGATAGNLANFLYPFKIY
ncbi:MAG: site-2 protease family protein [Eggerthellaceae bacterium]|nr:site-2 protease family protein [Eggerthellaceae bacterium]